MFNTGFALFRLMPSMFLFIWWDINVFVNRVELWHRDLGFLPLSTMWAFLQSLTFPSVFKVKDQSGDTALQHCWHNGPFSVYRIHCVSHSVFFHATFLHLSQWMLPYDCCPILASGAHPTQSVHYIIFLITTFLGCLILFIHLSTGKYDFPFLTINENFLF